MSFFPTLWLTGLSSSFPSIQPSHVTYHGSSRNRYYVSVAFSSIPTQSLHYPKTLYCPVCKSKFSDCCIGYTHFLVAVPASSYKTKISSRKLLFWFFYIPEQWEQWVKNTLMNGCIHVSYYTYLSIHTHVLEVSQI